MKKTYTRCKVGLFVGLLALHTLSSCSNKGQELGVNFSREQFGLTGGQVRRNYNANPRRCICNKLVMPCLGFVATGLAIGGSLYWLLSEPNQATSTQGAVANGTEPSIDQITDNATALATTVATTLGTGLVNLGNTTVAPMVTTAATAAGLFTTAAVARFMATPPINGLPSNGSSNRSYLEDNDIPSYLQLNTTDQREPVDLDDFSSLPLAPSLEFTKMVNLIRTGRLREPDLREAIQKEFDINEKDPTDGATLAVKLAEEIDKSQIDRGILEMMVRALKKHGADLNMPNNQGKTPLLILAPGISKKSTNKDFAIYLLNIGANLYQPDKTGKNTLDYIENSSIRRLMVFLSNQNQNNTTPSSQNSNTTTPNG